MKKIHHYRNTLQCNTLNCALVIKLVNVVESQNYYCNNVSQSSFKCLVTAWHAYY